MSDSPIEDADKRDPVESFEQLVRKAQSGDRNAIGNLTERYRKYLLLIANQDIGPGLRTKMGASDVVQDSLINAQAHFEQFHGTSEKEFMAWLKSILTNDIRKCHRHFATQKRDTDLEINLQEQSNVGRMLHDAQLTPSSDAIEKERFNAIRNALANLSSDQQQVIRLRNFEMLDFDEIGKRMGRSEGAARKLWARSIESLKDHLNPDQI